MSSPSSAQSEETYQWLLGYEQSGGARRLAGGDALVIDDENWRAEIFSERMLDGTIIYAVTADSHAEFELHGDDGITDTRIVSDYLLSGSVGRTVPGQSERIQTKMQGATFRVNHGKASHRIFPNLHLQYLGCAIPRDTLYSMLDGEVPACFAAYFDETKTGPRYQTYELSPAFAHVVAAAHANDLEGKLWHLFMEGILIQLTALQIAALEQAGTVPSLRLAEEPNARLRNQLMAAKEHLIQNLADPPTLGELAQQFDLTEKKLNMGFKTLFGTSVYETLRNERLELARLVLEREDVVLKQVAHRVGYKHVTNFITAFTKKFGMPPRQYLEQGED